MSLAEEPVDPFAALQTAICARQAKLFGLGPCHACGGLHRLSTGAEVGAELDDKTEQLKDVLKQLANAANPSPQEQLAEAAARIKDGLAKVERGVHNGDQKTIEEGSSRWMMPRSPSFGTHRATRTL